MSRGLFPSHGHAVAAAALLTVAAALAWNDAYEKRGRKRPWWIRFAPGVI